MVTSLANQIRGNESFQAGYPLIFIPEFISSYGLQHFELSMRALEDITQLISAEFAIRPFILQYPHETMKQMMKWSKHPSAAVRRLSSEGCRPRLPWAPALPEFKKDPTQVLAILENLKCDPSDSVRRSVANNLNDIAKDNPAVALQVAHRWRGKHPLTDWIVKHGCRTLLKKGDVSVLTLHGFNPKAKASVGKLKLSDKVGIGGNLEFRFMFVSREKRSTKFRIEYCIDYLTSSGKVSRKVFKLTENSFEPNDEVELRRRQSFKNFTTRKHYPGKHRLRILVNGKESAAGEFIVT